MTALEGAWWDDAATWLRSGSSCQTRLWPLLLLRGFPWGLTDAIPSHLGVYQRIAWTEPPHRGPYDLAATDLAATPDHVALASLAKCDGRAVAAGVTVMTPVGSSLPPAVPRVPSVAAGPALRRLIPPDESDLLLRLVDADLPLLDDDRVAYASGYAGRLVAVFILALSALSAADWPDEGGYEIWSLKPISVGAVLTLTRDPTQPMLTVSLPAAAGPAAILRAGAVGCDDLVDRIESSSAPVSRWHTSD